MPGGVGGEQIVFLFLPILLGVFFTAKESSEIVLFVFSIQLGEESGENGGNGYSGGGCGGTGGQPGRWWW